MSTTKTFKVNQNISRQLKCRAVGYYDYTNIVTPTKENSDINVEMQKYDGLKYTLNSQGGKGTSIVDFSDTVLPWKFEMNNYLARTRYCWKPYREEPYQVEILKQVPTNYNIVGTPTFNGNIVSGFNSSNYLTLKRELISNNNTTYVLKFTTGDNITTDQVIMQKRYFIDVEISASEGVLFYTWSPNGRTSLFTPQPNTTYWLKVVINGLNRTYSYSTNGVDFSDEVITEDSSLSTTDSSNLCLGLHSVQLANPFLGSIDLSESYIKQKEILAEGEGELIEQAFSQPILTENGTMGGRSFAVSADNETNGNAPAYYAFDNNDDTFWRGGNVPGYIDFYNPTPIKVTSISWGFFYSYPTLGNVQGSNDYSDWTTITDFTNDSASDFTIDMSGNTNSYKYYRINISSVNMDVLHCKQLTIVGTVKGYAVDVTYGLADCIYVKKSVINYNIVGSPTIENNIVSGFSRSNYLTLKEPFKPQGAWEIVLKFKTNESVGREQGLFGYNGTGLFKICLGGNNRMILSLSTVDNDWNIGEITGTTDIELNKFYWVKIEFTGTTYKLSLSTNGADYNLEGTLETSSIPVFPDTTCLGVVNRNYNSLAGSIDLSECYVEIDGETKPLVGSATEQLYGIIDDANFTTSLPVYCYANRDERVVLRNTKTEKMDTSDWYLGEVEIS